MYSAAAIHFHRAHKSFGPHPLSALARATGEPVVRAQVALEEISFEVQPQEIFGLLGPNGSGKSTLLRLVAARLAPDAGQVRVFGADLVAEPRAADVVIDRAALDAALFKKLSPVENLLHGARARSARPGETRRRVLALLARLELDPADYYRPVESLSRGVQQLVAIARACVAQPRLLLLDEPTAGLDPRARRAVHALVQHLRATDGVTVLLATHDLDEAEALCDRVALLDRGRLVAVDTPAGLRQRAGLGATLEDAFLLLTELPVAA